MSWLADIAGKAENFLNKIDQNAAVALNSLDEVAGGGGPSRSRRGSKTWMSAEEVKSDHAFGVPTDSATYSKASHESTNGSAAFNNNVVGDTLIVNSKDGLGVPNTSAQVPAQTSKLSASSQPSRSRSRPGTKLKSDQVDSGNQGSGGGSTSFHNVNGNKSKTDDELLEFLNSPVQKEIDETALLKSELATQSREMGMLLKNHKKLQLDYENQNKKVDELRKSLTDYESNSNSRVTNSEEETTRLTAEIKEKDKEIIQMRERLDETLEKLKGMDKLLELQNRIQNLELEKRQIESRNADLDDKVQSINNQLLAAEKQSQSAKDALAGVENEFTVYKEKAKSILKSKDELIISIKNQSNSSTNAHDSTGVTTDSQIMAEIGSLKNERELLHGEISQSRTICDSLKDENRRLESELQSLRSNLSELQEICSRDRNISHSIQEENLQLSQKLSTLHLELEREKSEKRKLEERVKKLTNDNERGFSNATRSSSGSPNDLMLSSSVSRANMSYSQSSSPSVQNHDMAERDNLKTRIKALSASLMEKQTLINNISSDKQLLQIRVERLQSQIQELTDSSESSSHVGMAPSVISSQPLYLSESPWDSGMTTRVKRAYSRVDTLCCQFGLAMRHRPNLRLGFSLYIICLHLWVFFILFYWSHSAPIHPYR